MTMKIKSTRPRRRTKPTKTGWHSLNTDELILWAYMWLGRTGNSRFTESQRTMALRLHVIRETLKHHLKKLVAANIIYLDNKKAPAKDGWNFQDSYTVTNPPACVLVLAEMWWAVGVERGLPAPYGSKVVHGETRINIDDARSPVLTHITTLCNQCKRTEDSPSVVSYGTLTVDSVGGSKVVHHDVHANIDNSRGTDLTHAGNNVEEELRDAEAKLIRLCRTPGVEEGHLKIQKDRITELKARLGGVMR